MKWKSTAVLGVLFLALCGAYVGMKYLELRRAIEKIEAKRIFDFAPETVRSLEITQIGKPASGAERNDKGEWHIVKPNDKIVPFPYLWDRVCVQLAGLMNERPVAEANADLKEYGLADPSLTVMFRRNETPNPVTLRFGDLTPTQLYRYARMDEGGVFLVHKDAFFELNRSLEELRSRYLVDDRESPLIRLEFARIAQAPKSEGEGQPVQPAVAPGTESVAVIMARETPEALWRLVSPVEAGADQELAGRLVTAIQYSTAWGFVDAPKSLADYGLDPPGARVSVVDAKSGRTQTVYFGNIDTTGSKPGMFARRADNPAVFQVDPTIVDSFPHTPDMFREKRLFTIPMTEARHIQYSGPADSFDLKKDEKGRWQMVPPDSEGLDQAVVSSFISAMKAASSVYFLEGTPDRYGLESPVLRMTVDWGDKKPPAEVRLTPLVGDEQYFAAMQDAGQIACVPKAQAEALMVDRAHFRSRALMRFSKEDAVKIEAVLEGQQVVLEKAHDIWLLRAPEGKTLGNQSDVRRLLDALSPLVAASLEKPAQGNLSQFGLEPPQASITVTTGNPADTSGPKLIGPLHLGKPADDNASQRYAIAPGRAGVFRVGPEVSDALTELLRGIQ